MTNIICNSGRLTSIVLHAALTMCCLIGCGQPFTPSHPEFQVKAVQYFPHIESVEYQDMIFAGQTFELRLVLSTDAKPSLLDDPDLIWRTIDKSEEYFGGRNDGIYSQGVLVGPVLVDKALKLSPTDPAGPATKQLSVKMHFTTPGTKYVYLQGLSDRMQGGYMFTSHDGLEYPFPTNPGQFEVTELQIEVLPAP